MQLPSSQLHGQQSNQQPSQSLPSTQHTAPSDYPVSACLLTCPKEWTIQYKQTPTAMTPTATKSSGSYMHSHNSTLNAQSARSPFTDEIDVAFPVCAVTLNSTNMATLLKLSVIFIQTSPLSAKSSNNTLDTDCPHIRNNVKSTSAHSKSHLIDGIETLGMKRTLLFLDSLDRQERVDTAAAGSRLSRDDSSIPDGIDFTKLTELTKQVSITHTKQMNLFTFTKMFIFVHLSTREVSLGTAEVQSCIQS